MNPLKGSLGNGTKEAKSVLKRLVSRMAVIGGVMAVVVGTSTLAYAGDTAEYVTVSGINRGLMTHIDDGDWFEVCDVYADGYGVTGYLYRRTMVDPTWKLVDWENDGGDTGCDYFPHDVRENLWGYDDYQLLICWRSYCESDNFHE